MTALASTGCGSRLNTSTVGGRLASRQAPAALPNPVFSFETTDSCFLAAPIPGPTVWPLAPIARPHPIRGSFNEPRKGAPHFGIDVAAVPNKAMVYSISSGYVKGLRRDTHQISIASAGPDHFLQYWHIVPLATLHIDDAVWAGEPIGHVVTAFYHAHVSEYEYPCGWINPMRPSGPLHVAPNRERPSIGPLHAFVANSPAFAPFSTSIDPALQTDRSTPLELTDLHGVVDLRAEICDHPMLAMTSRPQLDLEPAAIRAFLAPRFDRREHLSTIRRVYDGAVVLRPARLGTTIWRIWAFGTWRDNAGYFQSGPHANAHLGAAYVWHVGGRHGLDTRNFPNGSYQYCAQALTINGRASTSCTPVVIDN
jgi:hypothetical protein